jgi:hypothetical protein
LILKRCPRHLFRLELGTCRYLREQRNSGRAELSTSSSFSSTCISQPTVAEYLYLPRFKALAIEFTPKINRLVWSVMQPPDPNVGVLVHAHNDVLTISHCEALWQSCVHRLDCFRPYRPAHIASARAFSAWAVLSKAAFTQGPAKRITWTPVSP